MVPCTNWLLPTWMIFLQKNASITAELNQSSSPEMLDLPQNRQRTVDNARLLVVVLLWNIQVTVRVLFCFQGVLLIDCSLQLRANLRLDLLSYPFLMGEGSWIETCFYTYGGKQFWPQSGVSVNLLAVRSSQPICVIPVVNVLIFSAYLFRLSDFRLKIPLHVLASQPGEHMVKKHVLMSRGCVT